ncbi:DUF3592 domain-containing protein [Oxalobacteraceae bacterium]|nr:DUF3592 domain-containing protein [Oxalobacteraceae bacterium]
MLKVALYAPLVGFAVFCWQQCGAQVWALSTMQPVIGVLERVEHRNTGTSSRRSSRIEVRYRYTVAGQQYRGQDMTCCWLFSGGTEIDPTYQMMQQLQPSQGGAVTVWVDPARPARSVLFRYVPRGAMLVAGIGLFFGFFGARALERYLRRRLGWPA